MQHVNPGDSPLTGPLMLGAHFCVMPSKVERGASAGQSSCGDYVREGSCVRTRAMQPTLRPARTRTRTRTLLLLIVGL